MSLNKINDILKIEELLKLKNDYKKDDSIKGEIIREGVNLRLQKLLTMQTTLIGRIETNEPDFTEIYLRIHDADEKMKKKFKLTEDKKSLILNLEDFLNELKMSFKNKIKVEIEEKQNELKKIVKLLN